MSYEHYLELYTDKEICKAIFYIWLESDLSIMELYKNMYVDDLTFTWYTSFIFKGWANINTPYDRFSIYANSPQIM